MLAANRSREGRRGNTGMPGARFAGSGCAAELRRGTGLSDGEVGCCAAAAGVAEVVGSASRGGKRARGERGDPKGMRTPLSGGRLGERSSRESRRGLSVAGARGAKESVAEASAMLRKGSGFARIATIAGGRDQTSAESPNGASFLSSLNFDFHARTTRFSSTLWRLRFL